MKIYKVCHMQLEDKKYPALVLDSKAVIGTEFEVNFNVLDKEIIKKVTVVGITPLEIKEDVIEKYRNASVFNHWIKPFE